jgi:TetR/AcrR family transcriptional repressor of mexJK operon
MEAIAEAAPVSKPTLYSQLFLGMLQGYKHFRCLMGLQPGLSEAEKEHLIEAAVSLFLKGHGHDA